MEGSRILVVDDDPTIRSQLRHLLEADRCEVQDASSLAAARAVFVDFRPEIVLLDYELPDGTALDLLPFLKEGAPDVPVLVLTGHRELEVAVATIKAGAEQFLTKPIELAALRTMVRRLIEQRLFVRRDRAGEVRRARYEPEPFLGESALIRNLEREAKTVAGAESPVLLQGETGTGKGLLARWLHANSPRAKQAFVDLNCAGLSRELLDSELFGHAKGAFTGALAAKPGLFETADRGTFFLDEIGDTEVTLQPKILKVVEEKRFRRLGEVVERRVGTILRATLGAVRHQLVDTRHFAIAADDIDGMEYVLQAFLQDGPNLTYSFGRGMRGYGMRGMPTYGELMVATDADGVARGYLASEAQFAALKDLQSRNLVVPLVGDFGGDRTLRAVGAYLTKHSATVSAIYTSNVEQYLFQDDDAWRRYYANVASLPLDAHSVFVRAVFNYGGYREPGAPRGPRSVTMLSPVREILAAVAVGAVQSYWDVIRLSQSPVEGAVR